MPHRVTPPPAAAVSAAIACRKRTRTILARIVLGAVAAATVAAAPVEPDTAARAGRNWLARSAAPMGAFAGQPGKVSTYSDESGQSLFHVLDLEPAGFVVMAADDELEPVLAFSTESPFLDGTGTPLFDLLRSDVASRLAATGHRARVASAGTPARPTAARAKWDDLLAGGHDAGSDRARAFGIAGVSDVCVEPMVKSRWDQLSAEVPTATGTREIFIYNYYTPPYQPGNPNNYLAGCSPVAWAQIMRFHEWPTAPTPGLFYLELEGWPLHVPMRGGDGNGGAYNWSAMPLVPGPDITLEQIQAIGGLMLDAGIGTGASYFHPSYGTFASTTADEAKNAFHYAEAKTCFAQPGLEELMNAIRTSLDAGLPANLNIFTETNIGHSLVIDGYGYNAGTRYHHLNLGWSGHSDAWYNFPPVDVIRGDGSMEFFTDITYVLYNIDPLIAGEMITGRITAENGQPVGGATVTLATEPARSAITNSRGIYAFKGLAPATTYTVSAAADGYLLSAVQPTVTTGNSAVETLTTPNRIVDFQASAVSVGVSSPQGFGPGAPVVLSVPATSAQPVAWLRNGAPLNDTASASLTLASLAPADAGVYSLSLARGTDAIESALSIVGVASTTKVIGAGREVLQNQYVERNGNTFDQVLLEGPAASITSDYAERQITRISYIDLDHDIVQVEFSGPGTLTLTLDNATDPSLPLNYNQDVAYMKGHASIVITDATQDTHLSVFSVGRANAVNQSLFKPEVNYDGIADIAFIAIASRDGKFGGLRAANASFFASRGVTGVYAPGVAITGALYLNNVTAFDTAKPMICVGSAGDVRITGGDLHQDNGQPVRVSGLNRVAFRDGTDSHGNLLAARPNRAVLRDNGTDVTTQLVENPPPVTVSSK